MPLEEIVGLSGYEIKQMRVGAGYVFEMRYRGRIECPRCGNRWLRAKERYVRLVRHVNIGRKPSYLELEGRKYYCRACGQYFNQRFPGILPGRRHTEPYREQVFEQHRDGISQRTLAQREKLGAATIERWTHDYLIRKVSERQSEPCPPVLGLDERHFTRKDGYATTLCDLRKRKVYDVVLGRSEIALEGYFTRLKDRDRVKVVCMDLCNTYRALVRKHMPQARIVADRFHVIRLVNHHFLATWRLLDPLGAKNRGLLSLMRRHADRLSEAQRIRLGQYFRVYPIFEAIYDFKQKLCRLLLLKHRTARQCRWRACDLLKAIQELQASGFEPLKSLGHTLEAWQEEIACMWRFTKNNGITEGFHNKMAVISRRGYGYRNFLNYRLRVRALCA